ncbi:hypothetical protein D3C86_1584630 [compost metagenome]
MTETYSARDRVFFGVAEPLISGTINSLLRYKNLTLNLNFGYSWGGVNYNSTVRDKIEVQASELSQRNLDRRVLTERWMKPGDVTFFRKIENTNFPNESSSRFAMKENIFRLSSASLQYRINNLKAIGINSLNIGVNTSDVFYISTIERERGTSYPFARRVGLTLSTSF